MKDVRDAKASGLEASPENSEQDDFAMLLAEMKPTVPDVGAQPEMQVAVNDIVNGLVKYRATAKRHKLDFLAYLIEMAAMESLEIMSKPQKK